MEITPELAQYVIDYYPNLLTSDEQMAVRHIRHLEKIEAPNKRRYKVYQKAGWISDKPEVLMLLKDGYNQFAINCTRRILIEHRDEVYLNLCPKCGKLARTPEAKQCRFCGRDWH